MTFDDLQKKVKQVFPKDVQQLQETLIDKLDSFVILYTDVWKLFKNMPIFEFESICVHEDKFHITDITLGSVTTLKNLCQFPLTRLKKPSLYAIPIQEIRLNHLLMLSMS